MDVDTVELADRCQIGVPLFVYGYADGNLEWSDWNDILIAATIAVVCMLRVGVLSEDNPPEAGTDEVLQALHGYRPEALSYTRYRI